MNFGNQGNMLAPIMSHVKRHVFSYLYVIKQLYLNLLNILRFVCHLVSLVDFINTWMNDTRRVKNPRDSL